MTTRHFEPSEEEKLRKFRFEYTFKNGYPTYAETVILQLQNGHLRYDSKYGHPACAYKLPMMEITEMSKLICLKLIRQIQEKVLPTAVPELRIIQNEMMWYLTTLKQLDPRKRELWKNVSLGEVHLLTKTIGPDGQVEMPPSLRSKAWHSLNELDSASKPSLIHVATRLTHLVLLNNLQSIADRTCSTTVLFVIKQSVAKFERIMHKIADILESNNIVYDPKMSPSAMSVEFKFNDGAVQTIVHYV